MTPTDSSSDQKYKVASDNKDKAREILSKHLKMDIDRTSFYFRKSLAAMEEYAKFRLEKAHDPAI